MQKCKIARCGEVALIRNYFCQKHWLMVPWQHRRHVSKLLRKNDMMSSPAHDEWVQRAYGYVNKLIKESEKPPLPERLL